MWIEVARAELADIHCRMYQFTSAKKINSEDKAALYKEFISLRLNIPESEILIERKEFHKPKITLKNSNEEVFLSSSDAGDYVLLALGHRPLGVDLEIHRDEILDFDLLIESTFSLSEKIEISKVAADKKKQAFYEIWTKKEALIKAQGLKLENLKEIEVLHNTDPQIGFLDIGPMLPQKNMSAALCFLDKDIL